MFMGLQLHNIQAAHVAPAQRHLSNVATRPAADPASRGDYDYAWYHIVRAREELAALTRKYEEIKRQEKIAETAERISKMHQVFIEDVMALLGQCKPTINARRNKMIEISDDFAEAVKEFLEELKKVDAELARILAGDPDLLRKFLDKAESTNLRDELTKLRWREEAIGQQTAIATTRPAEGGAAVTASFSIAVAREQQDLARSAGRSHDKMEIWMPKEAAGMKDLTTAQTEIGEAARILNESAIAAAARQLDRAAELGSKALEHLTSAQTNMLAVASTLTGNDPAAPLFAAHRIAELERLVLEENAAIRKMQAVQLKRAGRALGLEQTQIKLATVDLARRIAQQLAFIQEISPPAVRKLDELIGILNGHIPEHEQEAAIALRAERRWDLAGRHVNNALEGYARAETLYDEALTLIEKMLADRAEKTPPMVPPPPALEQLLEALKQEKENLDKLGFAPPRLNLRIMSDWAGEGEGGAGGRGQDGQTSGQRSQEQQDAAQARAQAARREAEKIQQKAQDAQRDAADQRDRTLAEARKATITQPADGDVAGVSGSEPDIARNGRDFNVLASKLEEDITQMRGTNPPAQYKEAIESYFEVISEQAGREKDQ
jgi:hypothetical protein